MDSTAQETQDDTAQIVEAINSEHGDPTIDAIVAELEQGENGETQDQTDTPPPIETTSRKTEEEVEEDDDEEGPNDFDQRFSALSQREAKVRYEMEKEREELANHRTWIEENAQRYDEIDRAFAVAKENPVELLRVLDLPREEMERLAETAYYLANPEKAPAEHSVRLQNYNQKASDSRLERKLNDMQEKLSAYETKEETRARQIEFRDTLDNYLYEGVPEDCEFTAWYLGDNPHEAPVIYGKAADAYHDRHGQYPDDFDDLSYFVEESIREYYEESEQFYTRASKRNEGRTRTPQQASPKETSGGITNSMTSASGQRQESNRSLSDEELEREVLADLHRQLAS